MVLSNGLNERDNKELSDLEDRMATDPGYLQKMAERGSHAALLYIQGKRSVARRPSYYPDPIYDGCYDEDVWFATGKMVPPKEKK
jgi:hypothetical protein